MFLLMINDDKLTSKCLGCGKTKLIKGNFASSPFVEGNIEYYCKSCKSKMLISLGLPIFTGWA